MAGGLVVLALATGSAGVAQGAPARVVYSCGPNICDVRADGTGNRKLTRDGTWGKPYRSPTRSRSGARMTFSGRDDRVYVADGRARDRRRLEFSGRPRIHRHGKHVLVTTFAGSGTFVCKVPLSGGRSPCSMGDGFWSWGTGLHLLSAYDPPEPSDSWIGMYDFSAEQIRRVKTILPRRVENRFRSAASLSPDGRHLAVSELVHGSGVRIAVYDVRSGEHVRDVTRRASDGADLSPSWSPDGGEIVFVRDPEVRGDLYGSPQIGRIMRVSGRGGRARTVVRAGHDPSWST